MSIPGTPSAARDGGEDERVDVRRYLAALRRNARLIAVVVIVITGAVNAISLSLPPTYHAQAKIVLEEAISVLGQTDPASVQRRLATTTQLLTAPRILADAGRRLGVSGASLSGSVIPSIDPNANIINVVGVDERPARAAAIANAVTDAFLADRAELVRRQIALARQTTQRQIDELSARGQGGPELSALRQRLAELGVAESTVGTDLRIAERAQTPSSPVSPRPLRNAILALFASLFLGVLIALARDQLAPRAGTSRELSTMLELPVLAGIPHVPRRWRTRKVRILSEVEAEAYQTLRAALEFSAWGDDDRVLLVTSAVAAEGKTSATARLGRALARAGHKTLVVSADLRVPKLHELFDLPRGVGLAEILMSLDSKSSTHVDPELFSRAAHVVVASQSRDGGAGCLHVIGSGAKVRDPGRLVSGQAMRAFLLDLRRRDYDYVLIDAPPLIGLVDAQVIAQWTDAMLVVARLDRLTLDHVTELRAVLDRLERRALGLVVIGVQGEISRYYVGKRPATVGGELDGADR